MPGDSAPIGIHAYVNRGKNKGRLLHPHLHADGFYVVSPDRFEKNYVRVGRLEELPEWLTRGFSLRMSNAAAGIYAPSLINPSSIRGWR